MLWRLPCEEDDCQYLHLVRVLSLLVSVAVPGPVALEMSLNFFRGSIFSLTGRKKRKSLGAAKGNHRLRSPLSEHLPNEALCPCGIQRPDICGWDRQIHFLAHHLYRQDWYTV